MKKPRALVIKFPGTNCHIETSYALESEGFDVEMAHINNLLEDQVLLKNFHLLAISGGFSYGDDLGSGKIAANKLMINLRNQVVDFIQDNLVIGICNGFQVLVKAGLLPALDFKYNVHATLTNNDIGHFYCNWMKLENINKSKCVFSKDIGYIDLPVAHGEGKLENQYNLYLSKKHI
jgi:phosphoribosylformylglycinamidine synthase